mgnify:CR=1 FL=1
MSSLQEQRRIKVVQFIQIWKSQRVDWKTFTADLLSFFLVGGYARRACEIGTRSCVHPMWLCGSILYGCEGLVVLMIASLFVSLMKLRIVVKENESTISEELR